MITETTVRPSLWQNKKYRKRCIIAASVLLALAILVGACAIYLGDYYRADAEAVAAFAPMQTVALDTSQKGSTVFLPDTPTAGLIFYPGGKVESDAYRPLMAALAARGILCVLVDMPFRLAVLDINAADGVRERYPQIQHWYMAGHSLGGSMAATYVAGHVEAFDGLILLGSYATTDLSDSGLRVLSVYGSEDTVMNREKYSECKANLPDDTTELIIEGGCHAYFGMYGPQSGDGIPTVSVDEQIYTTADAICAMIPQ